MAALNHESLLLARFPGPEVDNLWEVLKEPALISKSEAVGVGQDEAGGADWLPSR